MLISKMAMQINNNNGRANSFSLFQSKKKKIKSDKLPKIFKVTEAI